MGDAAVAACILKGGVGESELAVWRWHLQLLLTSIGGVTGSDRRGAAPSPLRSARQPFERGTVPLRDPRFDTFKNTGDYDVADKQERFPKESVPKRFGSALFEPSVTKSMRLKHSAPSSGTFASAISKPNMTWLASPGMRLDIRRLVTGRSWQLAMTRLNCAIA